MTPDLRLRALNATLVLLDELHRDLPLALSILDRPEIVADLEQPTAGATDAETRDRKPTGSHSDPTGSAATATVQRTSDLQAAVATLAHLAHAVRLHLDPTCARTGRTLTAARANVTWCQTTPHSINRHQPATPDAAEDLDRLLDELHRAATQLAADTHRITRAAAKVKTTAPKQHRRRTCRSCARAGRTVDIYVDRYADLCRSCGDYKAAEGRVPPIKYVEWVYQRGRRPPAHLERQFLAEEKLPSRTKHKGWRS